MIRSLVCRLKGHDEMPVFIPHRNEFIVGCRRCGRVVRR